MSDTLGFAHRYVPPAGNETPDARRTLLMLHGTGGDENDLLPLGPLLLPGAALLSPRGKVSEGGALRFFRRIREGVFDQEDLARRTSELAAFVEAAAREYGFETHGVIAVGFSNGANIAGSMLLRRPELLRRAVLLSPMIPFEPHPRPDLSGIMAFIGAGRMDQMVPPDQTQRLADLLTESGADVTLHWEMGGHTISTGEIRSAATWLGTA